MAYECRRIVTGHTPEGKSTVLYDSSMPLLEADRAAGARQEDRAGAASAVIWTTQGPVNNDDPSDTALRKVGTAESDGTVFRIVRYAPGVAPRHHRTNSIDYAAGTEKGPWHTGTPNVTSPWCANSKPRLGSSWKAWTGLIQSSQPGYRRSPDRIRRGHAMHPVTAA
jgi:hypothetical protein